jgi:putative transposase
MSRQRRLVLIERDALGLSIARQCELVGISRASVYYTPKGDSAENEHLMRLIDAQYLRTPWSGARQMARHLRREGHWVNRKRIGRLMAKMGLVAVYPGPSTSKTHSAHRIYPYLLRSIDITRPNQAWCADVTYIPMRRGFLYLVAIMDWHSRRVLVWRLSNTLDTNFCVEALEAALACFGQPQIFNTDQGCQFTSDDFTGKLNEHGIRISMDGKGRWMDNVFIERLWRSLKYECVYLHALETPWQARAHIGDWIEYYNQARAHSSLEDRTPDEAFRGMPPLTMAA